jgi:hypothetical protein
MRQTTRLHPGILVQSFLVQSFAPSDTGSRGGWPTVWRESAISRREAPEWLDILSLQKKEGVGNAGCPMHPQPVCEKMHTVVTTVAPESPGIPARGWF